jgi:outer membrane protein OmpA-like peptidoglycan-associated protein
MLNRNRCVSRITTLFGVLLIASCAVEPPRPTPAPRIPAPPAPQIPTPPVNVTPIPKTYTGSYSERLEAAARDAVATTTVRVLRTGNTVKLIIPANAAFASGSAQMQPRFSAMLDTIARLCREYSKTTISIKGFTDSTGSFEHNQQLSEQRAQGIGAYLKRDIAAVRIQTVGYGPRYPIADNRTDEGRMQNRRVEIDLVITP